MTYEPTYEDWESFFEWVKSTEKDYPEEEVKNAETRKLSR